MTTEIFPANLTYPVGEVQYNWQYDVNSCNRPASDLGIPIICLVREGSVGIEGDAASYASFSACCPPSTNGTNIYGSQRGCLTFCLTGDETLAKGFDKCVKDEARKLENNTALKNATGRCEYIDYEMLKKGVKKSGASQYKVWSVQMIVIALLLVGGSLV